jgi:nicotinamidase-related amidase
VLAGIQTDCCVDATCRRAHDLGYKLVIAKDAHSTWSQGNVGADQIIDRYNSLFQAFADVIDSVDIKFG